MWEALVRLLATLEVSDIGITARRLARGSFIQSEGLRKAYAIGTQAWGNNALDRFNLGASVNWGQVENNIKYTKLLKKYNAQRGQLEKYLYQKVNSEDLEWGSPEHMEILRDFFLSANIEMGDVGVSRYGMQEVDEFGVPVAKNNSLAKFLTGEILKGKVINSVTAHAPTPKNLQKALMSEIPTPHKVAASLGLNIKGSKLNMGSGDEFFMDSKLWEHSWINHMDYNPAIHEAIITTQKGKMFMTQIRPVFAGQMLESNHPGSILWDTDWAHKRRWHYDSMGHKQGRMGAKPLATLARKASPHGFTRINTQRVVQRSMHPNMNGRL